MQVKLLFFFNFNHYHLRYMVWIPDLPEVYAYWENDHKEK